MRLREWKKNRNFAGPICGTMRAYGHMYMKKSEFTSQEEEMIQQQFQQLLLDYANTSHRQKVEIITHAFEFAKAAHNGVRRLSGEPYIIHPHNRMKYQFLL